MSKDVKIRKGVNIKLKGEADKVHATFPISNTVALRPSDFPGMVPKLLVKQGAQVKAGTPLFYHKEDERVLFTSPVSGEVAEIRRGDKRKILEVIVLADKEIQYESFGSGDISSLSREQVIETLLKSGCWPFIRKRPYDVIANPDQQPKAIVISAFDSAPLAPDNDFIVHGEQEMFQAGLDVVSKLTTGKVHLNVSGTDKAADEFLNAKGVEINKISGPHPAGLPGVQIHHIDPINKGEVVWVINPQDLLTIGRLFSTGKYDATRVVALTGSQAENRKYYKTIQGVNIGQFVAGNMNGDNVRIVSGNPLTGVAVKENEHLGFYDYQITVLPEGDDPEFMGWLAPGFNKFSLSRSFPSWIMPNKKYDLNTNKHGELRAFVVTGEYEKVFPFDIYPVQLLKAMITEDIEKMEELGVYEVAPEDFALCEFACTSKIEVQRIVREALELVKTECG